MLIVLTLMQDTNIQDINLIYKLYSFTCALGAHITEGNVNGENIDFETATLEDAFMALRMTESVLIWLYQTNALE